MVAVGVGVNVEVDVGVLVGVNVGVNVEVAVLVAVKVGVNVAVGVAVGVSVAVLVCVGVGVFVAVPVGVNVGVAVAAPSNVTVSAPLEPITTLHGSFVPVQLSAGGEAERLFCPLQPPNVEPPVAVTSNVTIAPFADVEMFEEQVLETVWVERSVPVPPQLVGAFTVPVFTVILTVPVPVPANVRVQFRASVNAPA